MGTVRGGPVTDTMPSHGQPPIYGRDETAYWSDGACNCERCTERREQIRLDLYDPADARDDREAEA